VIHCHPHAGLFKNNRSAFLANVSSFSIVPPQAELITFCLSPVKSKYRKSSSLVSEINVAIPSEPFDGANGQVFEFAIWQYRSW
jgi:hypothetical protein